MSFDDWKSLRQDAAFQELFKKVRTAVWPTMERSCLSHHTTGSCRANKAPISSLKACGLDDPIACPDGDGNVLRVIMANTFYEGDGRGLEYWSVPFPSSASGERFSCEFWRATIFIADSVRLAVVVVDKLGT